MAPVVRFSGAGGFNLNEAVRLVNLLNQYIPLVTQLMQNGLAAHAAFQQVIAKFNTEQVQASEPHQAPPPPAQQPQYWKAWDPSLGRYRVATYNQWGQPVWASN